MKTAIYIEDGVMQVVLTPESQFEKSAMKLLADKPSEVEIFSGGCYDYRGGLVRQSACQHERFSGQPSTSEDESIILKVTQNKEGGAA